MLLNLNSGCSLCPISCGADRTKKVGACGTDDKIKIAKYYLHKYEEPCISGEKGSGTIFFCGCSLKCRFCQNFELSRNLRGKEISVRELADIFKELEIAGAENINLVTPTQYSDKIVNALNIFKPNIPVVYNTHGYEKTEVLQELFPYIDIFLPDLKFFSPAISKRYTGKADYFDYASKAVKFMAQKPLLFDEKGMMKSGTIVRHLVLPANVEDSKRIIDFFADNLADDAYLNLMSQYTPIGDIKDFPELNRKITKREYNAVIDYAISRGIEKMFYQKRVSASEEYVPKWDF
ncbi:MAG: radical SAM protein [Clostridia bacterium]|nr:radical SAM protein [Clostridia bacterium]